MRASKVFYRQSVAPEGALVLERPTHGELSRALTDVDAAADVQRIGFAAWRASQWAAELAVQNGIEVDDLVRRAFDPSSNEKISRQQERIRASAHLGRRTEYWFGEAPKPLPDGVPITKLPLHEYMATGEPNGFVKIEQQGGNNNRLLRAGQYLARRGLYVCLNDMNIVPEKQGKRLGTALAYVGLSDQPRHLKSSLYTATNNKPMRTWAEKYGYHVTDEYIDEDLFENVPAPFVRYEANSVHQVLRRMEQANPWLEKGERSSTLGRVMREHENEILSLNPRGG